MLALPIAAFGAFAPYRSQFCPGSHVGNPIMQTRDGSVCTDGSQKKYPRASWMEQSTTAKQTMGGVICSRETVQQRQTAVNNVGLSSWRRGISVCFLMFITAVSEESSCQSLQAAIITPLSLCVCLNRSFIPSSFSPSVSVCPPLSFSISLCRSLSLSNCPYLHLQLFVVVIDLIEN